MFKGVITIDIIFIYNSILMQTHKSSDYKLSAVKYNLSHSQNQVQTFKKI